MFEVSKEAYENQILDLNLKLEALSNSEQGTLLLSLEKQRSLQTQFINETKNSQKLKEELQAERKNTIKLTEELKKETQNFLKRKQVFQNETRNSLKLKQELQNEIQISAKLKEELQNGVRSVQKLEQELQNEIQTSSKLKEELQDARGNSINLKQMLEGEAQNFLKLKQELQNEIGNSQKLTKDFQNEKQNSVTLKKELENATRNSQKLKEELQDERETSIKLKQELIKLKEELKNETENSLKLKHQIRSLSSSIETSTINYKEQITLLKQAVKKKELFVESIQLNPNTKDVLDMLQRTENELNSLKMEMAEFQMMLSRDYEQKFLKLQRFAEHKNLLEKRLIIENFEKEASFERQLMLKRFHEVNNELFLSHKSFETSEKAMIELKLKLESAENELDLLKRKDKDNYMRNDREECLKCFEHNYRVNERELFHTNDLGHGLNLALDSKPMTDNAIDNSTQNTLKDENFKYADLESLKCKIAGLEREILRKDQDLIYLKQALRTKETHFHNLQKQLDIAIIDFKAKTSEMIKDNNELKSINVKLKTELGKLKKKCENDFNKYRASLKQCVALKNKIRLVEFQSGVQNQKYSERIERQELKSTTQMKMFLHKDQLLLSESNTELVETKKKLNESYKKIAKLEFDIKALSECQARLNGDKADLSNVIKFLENIDNSNKNNDLIQISPQKGLSSLLEASAKMVIVLKTREMKYQKIITVNT